MERTGYWVSAVQKPNKTEMLLFSNSYAFPALKDLTSLIKLDNKWASPSGETCFITKIKGFDKSLGQFPVQGRALEDNSMKEIQGLSRQRMTLLFTQQQSMFAAGKSGRPTGGFSSGDCPPEAESALH